MEAKLKHLEMVQSIISRMASNSFLIKGWCVTLAAALIALSPQESRVEFVLIAYLPVLMFWMLDAFFLWQERLFRKLYDHVRSTKPDEINFSMDTSPFKASVHSWAQIAFSRTLTVFYGTLVGAILLVVLLTASQRLIGSGQ